MPAAIHFAPPRRGGDHGCVPITRRWKYAAPPWRYYEALVGERSGWLQPVPGERTPEIGEAVPDERVVFTPWVDDDIDAVEVVVASDGGSGTELTVMAHAGHELPDDRRKAVRYRLGVLFGDVLRHWVDGW